MNATRFAKRVMVPMLLAIVCAMTATTAHAQSYELRRPVPSGLPKLGFYGHIQYGWGLMVDRVYGGTEASRIGLERGDIIVSVNGRQIRNWNDYNTALFYSGGFGQMVVRDCRTGRLIPTRFVLNNGRGPASYGHQAP